MDVLGLVLVGIGVVWALAVQVLVVVRNPGVHVIGPLARRRTVLEFVLMVFPVVVILAGWFLMSHHRPWEWAVGILVLLAVSWVPRWVHNLRLGGPSGRQPISDE